MAEAWPSDMVEQYDPIRSFEATVARSPSRPAVRVGGRTLTYVQLNGWADAIAARIVLSGQGGRRISFVARKEASSYAAILAILKAGGSYVPLPEEGPPSRWASMVEQAGIQAMVGPDRLDGLEVIPISEEVGTPGVGLYSKEAYVLFTSGSTGGPKGVSVSRSNVAAYISHQLATYDFNETDRFSQFFALTFDLSVHDMFLCWSVGACLCVPSSADMLRAVAFARDEGITVWFSVPSLVMLMQRTRVLGPGALPALRLAFFCGEPLHWAVVRSFSEAAPAARLINLYGPTEATIALTAYEVRPGEPGEEGVVPIGKVFVGSEARVVEEQLLLGGPQVAVGYVGRPEATEHAFVTEAGMRWYRTGDRVRSDANGDLHFVGRIDDQVKIMGHRVEPAEVDAVLASLVQGHVITLAHRGTDRVRLYTFVDEPVDHAVMLSELRRNLPAYMLPERIINVETMPTTAHGKLDRMALLALVDHG